MKSNNIGVLKTYKKDNDYSYTLGAYATIEMIQTRPEIIRAVYIHSNYNDKVLIENLCKSKNILRLYDDKIFAKISQKENCYVLGVFYKYIDTLEKNKPHIILVNPGDMGNLGTIIRIAAGFNICNVGIITPAADIFNPRTIRASMGSLFRINHRQFRSFDEYRSIYEQHRLFPFMLHAKTTLSLENCPKVDLFSLIFGNEAAGLDEEKYSNVGTGIKIPQSALVDSLNISVAAGIGAFLFANRNGLI